MLELAAQRGRRGVDRLGHHLVQALMVIRMHDGHERIAHAVVARMSGDGFEIAREIRATFAGGEQAENLRAVFGQVFVFFLGREKILIFFAVSGMFVFRSRGFLAGFLPVGQFSYIFPIFRPEVPNYKRATL